MSNAMSDDDLIEAIEHDDVTMHGDVTRMARELLATRERIAELEGHRYTGDEVTCSSCGAVDLARVVYRATEDPFSRAVVEAAQWEREQGLASPHLCRVLVKYDRGEEPSHDE